MSETAVTDEFFGEDILEEIASSYVMDENANDEGVNDKKTDQENMVILKNPLCVPLDALHIERTERVPIKGAEITIKEDGSIDFESLYKLETVAIPALDIRWLTELELDFYQPYQPFYPQFSSEENDIFKRINLEFIYTLDDWLQFDFHKFWCALLFAPKAGAVLKEFIADPVYCFDYNCLNEEQLNVYGMVALRVLKVYQRMIKFKESEAEYLTEDVGMNFLISKGHLTTPIVTKLVMLYNNFDKNFVERVVGLYFAPKNKAVYAKELRETIKFIKTLLETVEFIVTEKIPSSIKPLVVEDTTEVRRKPTDFDPHWAQEMVAYILDCFFTLSTLLPLVDEAIEIAIELELPPLIPLVYNHVFKELESYMTDRASVPNALRSNINNYMMVARNEGIKTFEIIISYCIRRVVDLADHKKDQENLVEMYLEWIQVALDYELFITDYNGLSSITLQLDQISSFYPSIDQLRVKYIKASLETIRSKLAKKESLEAKKEKLKNCRLTDLWSSIWRDVVIADPPPHLDVAALEQRKRKRNGNQPTLKENSDKPKKDSNEEVEQMIRSIMDTLPHLGDGFILQCLEHYQFNLTDTLSAILDENLPPHLAEIPFDTPRIPEETEPEEEPFLAHKGKREDYKDAMQLLDDKDGIKDIRELIVINSMVKEDSSDDEFDDRMLDDGPVPPDDDGEERVFRHLQGGMKNLRVVSDPSDDSDEEEDGEASAMRPGAFCEDPAVIRARREAQRRVNGKGRCFDVVGKPKGQGQEKDVQHNRDKKNVLKSSRANHNRKKGAQWKRSRGMLP